MSYELVFSQSSIHSITIWLCVTRFIRIRKSASCSSSVPEVSQPLLADAEIMRDLMHHRLFDLPLHFLDCITHFLQGLLKQKDRVRIQGRCCYRTPFQRRHPGRFPARSHGEASPFLEAAREKGVSGQQLKCSQGVAESHGVCA